ncbi:hypothetical protein [Mucilaginibacter celer]|uniref:Uncharacterized protein n=1 Tax=Mucilaginibacter celer TaxID=2305508 RepID=A0A494VTW0_9SPHI|nr:hypothetical protein [Mucilaginibacter celer]AYL97501.1 hypothetical protein HYN43_020320 [Mucilaginibacter celer]
MRIEPYKSVGELLFSDSRQTIRKKLNVRFEAGVKSFGKISERYDYFIDLGLTVFYDKNDGVNAFDFFEGDIFFHDINLLKTPFNKLIQLFTDLDLDVVISYAEITSYKYGIGFYTTDDVNDPMAMPIRVFIFKNGYYDILL